jgi:hypothetical protein
MCDGKPNERWEMSSQGDDFMDDSPVVTVYQEEYALFITVSPVLKFPSFPRPYHYSLVETQSII